eukprot:1127365-Amorphochlora_amoeboformis.AAC.2
MDLGGTEFIIQEEYFGQILGKKVSSKLPNSNPGALLRVPGRGYTNPDPEEGSKPEAGRRHCPPHATRTSAQKGD